MKKFFKVMVFSTFFFVLLTGTVSAVSISNLELEKNEYTPEETVEGSGRVVDDEGLGVEGAYISAVIDDETKDITETDEMGYFSFSFEAPWEEGRYKLEVLTSKEDFRSDKEEVYFDVNWEPSLSVVIPSVTYIERGGREEIPVYIKNDGPVEINDLEISTEEIPFESNVTIQDTFLSSGEIIEPGLNIRVPEDSDTGISQSELTIKYNGKEEKESFAVHVRGQAETESVTGQVIRGVSGSLPSITGLNIGSPTFLGKILPSFFVAFVIIFIYLTKGIPRSKKETEAGSKAKDSKEEFKPVDGVKRDQVVRRLSFIKNEAKKGS